MRKSIFFILFASAAIGASAADATTALKPMNAVYSVVRDGKAVGDATYTLAANSDGSWTLRSITKGTAGMARLAGLDVREESTFRWQNGKIQGLQYDYQQDTSFKHKKRQIAFDWSANQAHVQEGKESFTYAIPAGTMDRSSVALVLGEALAGGTRDVTLPVAVKDRIEQQHFVAQAEETIQVPAGSFKATRFERSDAPGKARMWYAPGLTTLPLRVEQAQGDGSMIVLELKQK
jgi:hypothetical protein